MKQLEEVTSVAFSPDGKVLAAGGCGIIRLWNVEDGKLLHEFLIGDKYEVDYLRFLSSGKVLVSRCHALCNAQNPGTIHLWNVEDATLLGEIADADFVTSARVFSPDGKVFAERCRDSIRILNVKDSKLLCEIPRVEWLVDLAAFSSDGKVFVVKSSDFTELWNVEDGKLLHWLPQFRRLYGKARAHNEKIAAYREAPYNMIELYDIENSCRLRTIECDNAEVLAFSPNDTVLASGSSDRTICLWNVKNGKLVHELKDHCQTLPLLSFVTLLSFSPDGKVLAAGFGDGTVWLWKAQSKLKAGQCSIL